MVKNGSDIESFVSKCSFDVRYRKKLVFAFCVCEQHLTKATLLRFHEIYRSDKCVMLAVSIAALWILIELRNECFSKRLRFATHLCVVFRSERLLSVTTRHRDIGYFILEWMNTAVVDYERGAKRPRVHDVNIFSWQTLEHLL